MRDKASLSNFWRKDDALQESAELPALQVMPLEIVAILEEVLEQLTWSGEDVDWSLAAWLGAFQRTTWHCFNRREVLQSHARRRVPRSDEDMTV